MGFHMKMSPVTLRIFRKSVGIDWIMQKPIAHQITYKHAKCMIEINSSTDFIWLHHAEEKKNHKKVKYSRNRIPHVN